MHAVGAKMARVFALVWPLGIFLLLAGISQCEEDADGDGWTTTEGDCNDQDAGIHPDAEEVCDGVDQNCDGTIDEGLETTWYGDLDGDGYGGEVLTDDGCLQPTDSSDVTGDCDDGDASIHPGAEEVCDGLDQNCDGAADEGLEDRVWYLDTDGDGFGGAQLATPGCPQPDGSSSARGDCDDGDGVVYPGASDETGDGVDGDCGGTDAADPHVGLTEASLDSIQSALEAASDGQTVWVGPGTYLEVGLTMAGKAIALRSTEGVAATVVDGQHAGTVFSFVDGEESASVLDGFTLTGGAATYGGGIYLEASDPTLTQVALVENTADYGGGLYGTVSSPSLTGVIVTKNSAAQSGGGIFLFDASSSLTQVLVAGNTAPDAAGISLFDASPSLIQVTVVGNVATEEAGGLLLWGSSPSLTNVILAYNIGGNLLELSSQPTLSYCDLFSAYGASHNLESLGGTNLEVDPGFVAFSNDGDPSNDDLRLRPGSLLRDAGAPDLDGDGAVWANDVDDQDPDGTRADIGVYGGPGAAWGGYQDLDADGLYDAWEVSQGLDTGVDDSGSDSDGDGATNLAEFEGGTNPQQADSDGDGFTDGAELEAGSDPLNACAQPEVDGLIALQVPADYPTIQEAIDAVSAACRIEVAAGTYVETLVIAGKGITLQGLGGEADTVLEADGQGSVVTAMQADVVLEGFMVQGGDTDASGGGLFLMSSEGRLEALTVTDNVAAYEGGGIALAYSSPEMIDLRIRGNEAYYGGGINLYESSSSLDQVTVSENVALGDGGGIRLTKSNSSLQRVTVSNNAASGDGGGIQLYGSSPTLTEVMVSGNTAGGDGGGILLYDSDPSMTLVSVLDSQAGADGAGLHLTSSSPVLTQVTVTGNLGTGNGGGMALLDSSPSLTQVVVGGNAARSGGGMYLEGSSPSVVGGIIAYNTGSYNLYSADTESAPTFAYCDVYNTEWKNLYGITLDDTNLTEEPGFLVEPIWVSETGPWVLADLHLGLESPLVDGGPLEAEYNDVDGSRADMGIYGGPGGRGWDRDGDGFYDYFWPGRLEDAPSGLDPLDWDGDDGDPEVH